MSNAVAQETLHLQLKVGNCEQFLSTIFATHHRIALKGLILDSLSYYTMQTTDPELLGTNLVQFGLMIYDGLAVIKSMPLDADKNYYIYDLLQKKVELEDDFVRLFKALFGSGNEHIAQRLYTSLQDYQREEENLDVQGPTQDTQDQASTVRQHTSLQIYHPEEDAEGAQAPAHNTRRKANYWILACCVVFVAALAFSVIMYLVYSDDGDGDPEKNPTTFSTPSIEGITEEKGTGPKYTVIQNEPSQQLDETTRTSFSPTEAERQLPSPPENTITVYISAPADISDFETANNINLQLQTSIDTHWEDWSPKNADRVVSLELMGPFCAREIKHFLSIMRKVSNLFIDNLHDKICEKNFSSSSLLVHEDLTYLRVTHGEDQKSCKSIYQFLDVTFDFPRLKRVELVNLPMMEENEGAIMELFSKYDTQLTHLALENMFVHMDSQAFANSTFTGLRFLHANFRVPTSQGAKRAFVNLNRATKNLVEVSTNLICTLKERRKYAGHWQRIKASKQRMICDVQNSL